jgi:hypothetical protein
MPVTDGIGAEVENIEEAFAILAALPQVMQSAIKDAASEVRDTVYGRTPYWTGRLRRGWGRVQPIPGGKGYTFGNRTPYSGIVEFGEYKNSGPRTVAVGGNIFSKFVVDSKGQGMIRPVVEDDAELSRMSNKIVEAVVRELQSYGS